MFTSTQMYKIKKIYKKQTNKQTAPAQITL